MMTLLEAISPTARELLRVDPKCACKSELHKVHAVNHAGRPLCGGGRNWKSHGRSQLDLGPVNCAACLAIMERRAA